MKKVLILSIIVAAVSVAPLRAEPTLTSILDNLYGIGNYTEVSQDQFWVSDGSPNAAVAAIFAGAGQNLYTGTPNSGTPLSALIIGIGGSQSASRFLGGPANFTPVAQPFVFVDDTSPSGYQIAYSQDSLNHSPDSADRMRTFLVTGTPSEQFSKPRYVIAFEDGNDFDYQDLVVETQGVKPVPDGGASLSLLGLGMIALASVRRKLASM
jgi:hypothetical protein